MKKHTIICICCILFYFYSCGNGSTSKKTVTQEYEIDSNAKDEDDEIIDLFAELDEDGWEMDEETEAALSAFEDFTEGVEGFSLQMQLESLLNKHQVSRGELDRSIEAITRERLSVGASTDASEEASEYAQQLRQKMTNAGIGMTLEEAEALILSYNKNNQHKLTSKYDTKGARTMATKVLQPLNRKKPGFLEENLSTYNREDNKKRLQTLTALAGTATKKEVTNILTAHYGINQEELAMLESVPTFFDKIPSEKAAKQSAAYEYPEAIAQHLKSGTASTTFTELVTNALEKKRVMAQDFISFAKIARLKFYKDNPNWAQNDNSIDNTYVDERGNFIFLPIGDLSFADVVVETKLGNRGEFPEGALGIPDMSVTKFFEKHPNICNLGLSGNITLAFIDNVLTDVNGPDLYIFEMGAIEPTQLEISSNGTDWINVGKIEGGTAKVDIAPYVEKGQTFNYIRLIDLETNSGIPGADIDAVGAIGGAMLLSLDSSVLFDSGSFMLRKNAPEAVKKLKVQIQKFSKGNILVQGHTDSDGSSQGNLKLSQERAKTVAKLLKEYMPSSFKITSEGLGESQPIVPNDTDYNKQKNRRVEILITPTNH